MTKRIPKKTSLERRAEKKLKNGKFVKSNGL